MRLEEEASAARAAAPAVRARNEAAMEAAIRRAEEELEKHLRVGDKLRAVRAGMEEGD